MKEMTQDTIARRQGLLDTLAQEVVTRMNVPRHPSELDPDAPLFGSGLGLDSLDAVELVVLLEADYGIKDDDPVAIRSAMRSLNGLVDLILYEQEKQHVTAS